MTATHVEPARCPWPGIADPLYAAYHDREWGVPHADEQRLFEKLILEGFQAGLSWLTILRKRENFRRAFDRFDAARMARYGAADIERLLADASIIRSRAKIEGAIASARAYLAMRENMSLAQLVWSHADDTTRDGGRHAHREIPPQTQASRALAKALKAKGFKYVGPTTAYAFMQSVGMVNDHLVSCHRHQPCAGLQSAFRARMLPAIMGKER